MFLNVLSTAFKNINFYKYFNDIVTAAFLWKDIGRNSLMFVNEIGFFRRFYTKSARGHNKNSEKMSIFTPRPDICKKNTLDPPQSPDVLYELPLRKKAFQIIIGCCLAAPVFENRKDIEQDLLN